MQQLKLFLDLTGLSLSVTKLPAPKMDMKGNQRTERNTGRLMWTTQCMVQDPIDGANVIDITTAGEKPNLSVNEYVTAVRLQAIPYLQGGREGNNGKAEPVTLALAFRATDLIAVSSDKAGKKAAASS